MTENNDQNKSPFSKGKNGNNMIKPPKFNAYWIYGLIAVAFIALNLLDLGQNPKETSWQKVKNEMIRNQDVDRIVVIRNLLEVNVYLREESLDKYPDLFESSFDSPSKAGPHYTFPIGSIEQFAEQLIKAQERISEYDRVEPEYTTQENYFGDFIGWILPFALIIGIWFYVFRRMSRGAGGGGGGGNIFNVGKSKAKVFDKESNINVNFNDVAGLAEAKQEVEEIVEFLKHPQRYTKLGGKIPKGALLVGPPGTGKTLLAKAVAGEAQVPFFSLSGSDFVEMFVGVGASRVRDLFKQAKEKAPCIVFIDEIDAIGRARGKNPMTGANDERENTLNQLLTEMDGFSMNTGVIILAATNRADILDRALLRAGRFDRQIHVELPDLDERRAIFDVHIKPLRIDKETVNVDFLAKQTPGFSGADIANVCNESALIGARRNKKKIDKQDFMDAIDRIIGGLEKKNKIITSHEKKVIAYHEAGHAAVSWLLEYAHPLVKVTIIPRGKSLGAAWYLPEERQITTKDQMLDEMTAALGGRASEQVHFGEISTGALNDLEKVTKQAYNMVVYFGLNDKIGNISYYDSSGQQEYSFHKPYSENTAELIDEEISKLIEGAYARAIKIIDENKEKVSLLAERLLEHEVIFREDVEEIFGKRNFEREERDREEKEQILKLREEHRKKMMEESEKLAKAEAEKNDEKPEEKNGAPQDAQDETVEETKNS
jgi:cell division protease FtsH